MVISIPTIIPNHDSSWENGMKSLIQREKHAFFLTNTSKLTLKELDTFEFSATNICVGLGYGIARFSFLIGLNFSLALWLTAIITLWIATTDFCNKSSKSLSLDMSESSDSSVHCPDINRMKRRRNAFIISRNLENDQEKSFDNFLESYTELKKLAYKINESLGEVFLTVPFSICFFYATELGVIFAAERWLQKLNNYYYFIKAAILVIMSADICRKVSVVIIF